MYIAQYISKFQIDIESEQGGEGIKSFFDESEERIVALVSFSRCSVSNGLLLGQLAKIKVSGVLPAHLPLVLDAGTVLVSVPPLSCAGFVCCHCTRRRAVLDNTHGKNSDAFR